MQTLLTHAIRRGDLGLVEQLLLDGADPNEADGSGESPLMVAAMAQFIPALALLLANGAEINRAYQEGWTALHAAVDSSIDSTIQRGGNPGEEPLEAVLWLVQHGADTGSKTNQGETALDMAESYRAPSMSKLLRSSKQLGSMHDA